MNKYRLISKKGEGTFSEVLKAQSIKTGKSVAIKCMKNHFDSLEQVNNLREIQALRRLSPHPHIIKLLEVLYDEPTGRLALVFELMDMNMYESIKGKRHFLPEPRVKNYMYQLLKSLDHMHSIGIFHRDIKPENILLLEDTIKLADFGSCRGIYARQPFTEYISTRWYRAPECLLTDGYYNYKMDIWGVGCVFFEVLSLFPLFPGNDELDQVHKIHNILGTPPKKVLDFFQKHATHMDFNFPPKEGTGIAQLIPQVSPVVQDLILKLLAYTPEERPTAKQALNHPCFAEFRPADKKLPTIPPSIGPPASGENPMDEDQKSSKLSSNAKTQSIGIGIPGPETAIDPTKSLKRIQQGNKKGSEIKLATMQEHAKLNISGDSDDATMPNLPPIKHGGNPAEPRKSKKNVYGGSDYKAIFKPINPHSKKSYGPTIASQQQQALTIKKITGTKKAFISPYSLKPSLH